MSNEVKNPNPTTEKNPSLDGTGELDFFSDTFLKLNRLQMAIGKFAKIEKFDHATASACQQTLDKLTEAYMWFRMCHDLHKSKNFQPEAHIRVNKVTPTKVETKSEH